MTSATQTAVVFTLEPVWAAIFGFWLAGDRLGLGRWAGCFAIMAGIVLAGREGPKHVDEEAALAVAAETAA